MNTNVHDKKEKEFIILIQPSPLRNLKTAYGWKNESGFKKTVFSPSPCKTCALQNYKLKRSSPPRHQVVVSRPVICLSSLMVRPTAILGGLTNCESTLAGPVPWLWFKLNSHFAGPCSKHVLFKKKEFESIPTLYAAEIPAWEAFSCYLCKRSCTPSPTKQNFFFFDEKKRKKDWVKDFIYCF